MQTNKQTKKEKGKMFIKKRKPLCDTRNKNGGARREFWQGKSDLNRFKRSINLKEKKQL